MLQIMEPKQDGISSAKNVGKKNCRIAINSRKRTCLVTNEDDVVLKRLCIDVNINKEDLDYPSNLEEESVLDLLDGQQNVCQANKYSNNVLHQLIGLMYQLDLSVLCSLRRFTYEHKYPSLSLVFRNSKIDKFNNIVICHENKSIHIKVENVDKYYTDNNITYAKLFTKEKRSFYINNYFDSFVKHQISNLDNALYNVEYLIIYSNSGLDLTEENKLIQGKSRNFYPFKFDNINMKECDILRDFLLTNDNTEKSFYQFSQDDKTRIELIKRLEFSLVVQKVIRERNFSQEFENKIKYSFLDKVVFVVNQPNREQLNAIIKNEIKNNKISCDYIAFQKEILSDLTDSGKHKIIDKLVPGMLYEFSLLMCFLHDMFTHKNIFSINCEKKCGGSFNVICIHYIDKIAYIKTCNANNNIVYNQLFPSRQREENNMFSINKYFTLFIEELAKNIEYFIIYTNKDLDLTEGNIMKKSKSKHFYPLKFVNIDIQKRKYNNLRDCLGINENGFYQFSKEEIVRKKLLSLLKIPLSLQKERKFSYHNKNEIKEIFLDKLIFAVKQPNEEKLSNIVKNEIKKYSKVLYNYEELHEIALRWSESHDFGPVTKAIMTKLFTDIKNNRFSNWKVKTRSIDKEFKFAKSVVGREETPAFDHFLNFLIKGKGIKYLEILKRKGINLTSMSSILNRAGSNAVKAFEALYFCWFDEEGNETQYLTTLEKEINFVNMSSILNGAAANAAKAFKELYSLWFDEKGCKTQNLKTLEENGICLANFSSILNGAGVNSEKAFKDLYDLWFDTEGNKTQYLKALEVEGINLTNITSILNGAGANAAKSFKDLYDLWFDVEGNKKLYLKSLEEKGINMSLMSSILSGTGANASKTFKDLYYLWFDVGENKTQYLKTLEEEGIHLKRMTSILSRAGVNAAKAFKGLYDLWFDAEGNKTQYLKTLEKEGINLKHISSILHGAGAHAARSFQDLYETFFDAEGNKTERLKTLEKEGINLKNVSSILNGAGSNAAKAFKDLYKTLFDMEGNKKPDLQHFMKKEKENGFTAPNISSILSGAGANPTIAFEKFHNACFNDKSKRTQLLEDFYKAGFRTSNLSCMLCGSGVHASFNLKRLHSICFNDEGVTTQLLGDFCKAGFRLGDLCTMLSAAVDSFKQFHYFCFLGETKLYLNNFLREKEGFTLSHLSQILHGARANICSALTDFHNVCFDNTGNITQLLNDFYNVGFLPDHLSSILSMSGNNATTILRNFHKLSFNKKKYINHFLGEKKVFTPKTLSHILHRIGINICSIFENLHNLCFDEAGNKTKYLNNLITNNQNNKMFNILYEKVRGAPSTFLNSILFQQHGISEIEEIKIYDLDDP